MELNSRLGDLGAYVGGVKDKFSRQNFPWAYCNILRERIEGADVKLHALDSNGMR
jgi:hypothetical protein